MYDVVIIGAGASGVMCACNIKENNSSLKVLVLEKNDKLGKKLSMTGNGRCNLGNIDTNMSNFYNNSNLDRFKNILQENKYLDYIKKVGILIKEDAKRLYPYSNQAMTVCKSFERYLEYLNVKIKYNYEVSTVEKDNDVFIINNDIKAKKVVIATGGKSYPKTGSIGTGYNILRNFGHKIEDLSPSLTYLKTNYKYIKELQGVRADALVNLSVDDIIEDKEEGQVQFTKEALSGICVFNLSRNVFQYLKKKKKVKLIVNLIPEYSVLELKDYLNSFLEYKIADALSGLINNKLAYVITKQLKIYDKKIKGLKENEIDNVLHTLHNMCFDIIETGNYDVSQVTKGGASLEEFTDELQSLKCNGLYAIGEVLDVDGKCGGYNLSWAFNSALIASDSISKLLN